MTYAIGPLDLLILQPSPFCNLACDYCYLPHKDSRDLMSVDTVAAAVERVFEAGIVRDRFTIVWHAGEPLTVPIAFYEEAFAEVDRVNRGRAAISHSFQTNATPITKNWCDFIKRHDVRIGVSIDGPAHLHDLHRVTRSGRGTHDLVMRGVARLQDARIPFHVISVLTKDSLAHPEAMFRFYLENRIDRVGFNIEETEGVHERAGISYDAKDAVKSFMRRFLDAMRETGTKMVVREFQSIGGLILHRPPAGIESQENAPFRIISVDTKGGFSTFSPELLGHPSDRYGNFILGNVADQDAIRRAAKSAAFRRIRDDIAAGIRACKATCDYFSICGGGAPSNKLAENGSFASAATAHCELSKKAIADVLLDDAERVML